MTSTTLAELPYYEELVIERIPHLRQDTIRNRQGEVIDVEEVEDEEAGYICQFSVADIRKQYKFKISEVDAWVDSGKSAEIE